ncbi:MAG TPA: L,D-transpeptidase [Actinomycetales bacterium]|nr:L,D-transpeptidase [Actinomycetales bacterium]
MPPTPLRRSVSVAVPDRRHLAVLGISALLGAGVAFSVSDEVAAPAEAEERVVAEAAPAGIAGTAEETPVPVVVDDRFVRSVARELLVEQQQPEDLTNLDLVVRDVLGQGPRDAADARRATEATLLGHGPGGPLDAAEPADTPCPPSARACIDVSGKSAWLQEGGRVTYGPVPVTTGRPGYETALGSHRVLRHVRHDHSIPFDSPMPFSTYFTVSGMAFHEGRLEEPSHGCIHLGHHAASEFFEQLRAGDEVFAF